MTTKFVRFTQRGRELLRERFNSVMGLLSDLEGLRQSFERQGKNKACRKGSRPLFICPQKCFLFGQELRA